MIKTKTTKKVLAIMLAVMMLFVAFLPMSSRESKKVSAAVTSRYTLLGRVDYVSTIPFDSYETYTWYSINSVLADHFEVVMYGSVSSGYDTASSDDYFNFDDITILAIITDDTSPHNSNYDFEHISYELKNHTTNSVVSSGSLSGSGSKTLVNGYVPEGEYTLTYVLGGSHSGIGFGSITYTFTYDFIIDSEAPTYSLKSGGSYAVSGSYVNEMITFSATDTNFNRILYSSPSSSSFSSTSSTSYSVSATSSNNGWWEFKAMDDAVNYSTTVTLYLDTIAPEGEVKVSTYSSLDDGEYTSRSFYYQAEDETGYVYCEIKRPNSSTWSSYTSGTSVSWTSTNGWYAFRSYDAAGNYSDIIEVYLDTEEPEGDLYADGSWVGSGTTTDANYIMFRASDDDSGIEDVYVKTPNSSYYTRTTSGSQFTEEGTYYFYAEDKAGNDSDIYVITIDRGPDHEYVVKEVVSPTCTEQGYTIYECTICGETMNDDFTPALGHSYIQRVVAPTCSTQGYTINECSRCGHTYNSNYTDATGHTYTLEIISPTCTTQGYTRYTCTDCGHTYTDNFVSGGGHEYETVIIPATCTEDGYTTHVCKHCGHSYISDIIKAEGHSYESKETDVTCTEQGGITHTCTTCGHSYMTEIIQPSGHQYVSTVITTATCEESGLRHHVCEVCGDEYENIIPATGHDYEITDVTENDDGTTTRTYTCKTCGHSYQQELGNQLDTIAAYIEELFDKYSPYMWWTLIGTSGVWSVVMGVFYIMAQKNEDKEKARKMLVNYCIGLVAIAVILVACPFLINGIAILIS